MKAKRLQYVFGISLVFVVHMVAAGEPIILEIKDHKFSPTVATLPANTKVELVIRNLDATPEEFESEALHREKIIPAKSEARLFVGPLKPGRYSFVGEFHPESARGELVVN